jgi:hypothetical protein
MHVGDEYFMAEHIEIIYDQYGTPVLRLFRNGRLVGFDGRSIGFVSSDKSVYDYSGNHKGWYSDDILRDHSGNCSGFGSAPSGTHPLLPIKKIPRIPSIPNIEPIRPVRSIPPIPPIPSFAWSRLSPIDLIMGN